MRRLAIAVALLPAVTAGLVAHAGLRFSSPLEGATLGDTPAAVLLTFAERPDPSVSSVQVLDSGGVRYDVGAATLDPGNPSTLSVRVRPLGTGVYTVNWRAVSSVDGHATS